MIEIRKAYTSRMTWAQLKAGVKDSTAPLYAGDEIDITLKTGENVTLVCERIRNGRATFFTKDLLEDADSPDEAENIAIYDKFADAHFGELEDADCFVEYVEDEDGKRYY